MAATMTSAGVMPDLTMSSISRCTAQGALPSVPKAIVTPASLNRARLRAWMPNASWAAGRSVEASCISRSRSAEPCRSAIPSPLPHRGRGGWHQDHLRPLEPESMSSSSASRSRTPWANTSRPGPEKPFRVLQREAWAVTEGRGRWGLVDDGTVQIRRQLLVLAVAVVDPDLDDVDGFGGQLLDGALCLRLCVDPVGASDRPGSGRVMPRPAVRDLAPWGTSSSPHLKREVDVVVSQAHDYARPRSTSCVGVDRRARRVWSPGGDGRSRSPA